VGRLTNLKPAIGKLKPSVAYMPEGERERDRLRNTLASRQLYQTPEWRALRSKIKLRDHYKCQRPECGRICGGKGEAVVDHREPHRGDRVLFFDERNLWTLCKPCHDSWKQKLEARAGR
jgi:5-methylcytosine-specific restriction endonuclease McrA